MSTFVKEGLDSLGSRFAELELLINEASIHTDSNTKLYSALCRSSQILLISHFEGYIKDFVKNVLEDINYYSSFKESNTKIKFTFCEHFIPPKPDGKPNEKKILELIELLDTLSPKFDKKYFLYENNKNPKESIIETIIQKFGENAFFKKLNNSILQNVFSNTEPENKILRNELKNEVIAAVSNYPYAFKDDFLNIDYTFPKKDLFWETYLREVLRKRHSIVHGSPDNTTSHAIIDNERVKLEILVYAFTGIICKKCIATKAV